MLEERKSYRLLIIAYDASLLQILVFVRALKKENPSAVIHLLTNRKMDTKTEQIRYYVTRIYRVLEYTGRQKDRSIAILFNRILFRLSFIFLSFLRYDVVNIHFAIPSLLKAMPWIQRMTSHIAITPWGSDVLRVEDGNAVGRMREIYRYASAVTVNPSSQLGSGVIEKFQVDGQKIHPLRWGLEYVDFIEEKRPHKTTEQAKARFGLSGRYVISCGYSTAPSHRHGSIIDAIDSVKDELPDNLTLLFPFTYGWGGPQYVQSIKEKCRSLGMDAVYVEEFLSMEDMYTLRMATDMFVHVQTTDAGAACVMQYILCNKKIVHGSWMKYVDLEQFRPLFYFPVDRMEDLGRVILEAYHSEAIEIPEGVIQAIMDRGWNKEMKKWDALFSSMAC